MYIEAVHGRGCNFLLIGAVPTAKFARVLVDAASDGLGASL